MSYFIIHVLEKEWQERIQLPPQSKLRMRHRNTEILSKIKNKRGNETEIFHILGKTAKLHVNQVKQKKRKQTKSLIRAITVLKRDQGERRLLLVTGARLVVGHNCCKFRQKFGAP